MYMYSNPCQSVVDEMKILVSNDDGNKVMAEAIVDLHLTTTDAKSY
jgi:hypothetical protein